MEIKYPDAQQENSYEDGMVFQDFVSDVMFVKMGIALSNYSSRRYQLNKGENAQRCEIKLDARCTETGRLSIEVGEKTRNDQNRDWVDSGIMRDNMFYVQGNYKKFYVFANRHLRSYYKKNDPEVSPKYGTIRTFYIPEQTAEYIAIASFSEKDLAPFRDIVNLNKGER